MNSALCCSSGVIARLAVLDKVQIEQINDLQKVPALIEVSDPDLLLIYVDSLNDQYLSTLTWLRSNKPIPVVIFAQENQEIDVKSVVEAGVTTYITGDVSPDRLPTILDLAFERFTQNERLSRELAETKRKLSDRKLIEKAKGLLMRQRQYSEEQAYTEMRKSAMNQGITMTELAVRIISVFDDLLD